MGRFPFIGPSYNLASVSADAQECMNWLIEPDETGKGRSPLVLKRTPGLNAFCNLTALGAIRGMWAGENRLFAVAGIYFVEIFSDGTYNNRSTMAGATTVGNDGKPVSILANGTQVLIVSAGHVYCDNGLGPVLVSFTSGSGTADVDATGKLVSSDSGSEFFDLAAPQYILVNGGIYQIASVTDANDLVLTTAVAGAPLSGVSWSGYGNNGIVDVNHDLAGDALLTLASGDPFPSNMAGAPIVVGGISYTVSTQTTTVPFGTVLTIPHTGAVPPKGRAQYAASVPITAFMGTYMDTYFIVAQPSSPVFYISANDDGTTWDAIDQATKEGYPDDIASIKADHEQLYIQGDECSLEVWLDTGAALFPFQRNASQTIHWGNRASWSTVRFGNGIAWIAGDQERGGPYAFYAEGSSQSRISTFAIEQKWATYPVVSDAVAYAKIEDGHEILIISFPTANATWCYDRTVSMQMQTPCWHRRGWWNGTSNDRHRASFHASVVLATVAAATTGIAAVGSTALAVAASLGIVAGQGVSGAGIAAGTTVIGIAFGTVTLSLPTTAALNVTPVDFGKNPPVQPAQSYVGDWQDGIIYTTTQAMTTDNGNPITRVRISPNVAGTDNLEVAYSRFELLIDLGPGTPTVPAPVVPLLSYSNDGARTYRNPQTRTVSAGITDQWECRFVWNRQGQSRPRTYMLTMNDATQFTVLDAFVEAEQGNG